MTRIEAMHRIEKLVDMIDVYEGGFVVHSEDDGINNKAEAIARFKAELATMKQIVADMDAGKILDA